LDVILHRIGRFLELGLKEIVISGIDITSYGKDLEEDIDFADVLVSILKTYPSLNRLRISSIDPKCIDEKLFELFTQEQRILPHFHLSIQSGDNTVLKHMRRRHNREDVIEICNRMLSARKDIVFGSDFIAGFPGETELMFQNTLNLVDEAHLSLLHVFPYSPRKGTLAASMVQLPRDIILKRAKILREKASSAKTKLFASLVGQEVSGLIEEFDGEFSIGKTDSFLPFKIKGQHNPGDKIQGKVTDFSDDFLNLA
jgi:threonylcarbamoyladenosine tRNA methylthiotransferase MtaB